MKKTENWIIKEIQNSSDNFISISKSCSKEILNVSEFQTRGSKQWSGNNKIVMGKHFLLILYSRSIT